MVAGDSLRKLEQENYLGFWCQMYPQLELWSIGMYKYNQGVTSQVTLSLATRL